MWVILGSYRTYTGTMEKKIGTTIVYSGYIGIILGEFLSPEPALDLTRLWSLGMLR